MTSGTIRAHAGHAHTKRTSRVYRLAQTAAALLGLALSACGGSALSRGADYYEQRCYIDAAQVFEHNEANLAEYDAGERARYALYRGQTLLALGDYERARHWLGYGERIVAKNAGALSRRERTALILALASIDGRAGAARVAGEKRNGRSQELLASP
jgi:hypothetical protein